jgi:hypothetical protein
VLIFVLATRKRAYPSEAMSEPLGRMIQRYTARLVEKLQDTKRTADRTGNPYARGRECGFYMALTILTIHMKSIGIDPKTVGLEGVDPDDLI